MLRKQNSEEVSKVGDKTKTLRKKRKKWYLFLEERRCLFLLAWRLFLL